MTQINFPGQGLSQLRRALRRRNFLWMNLLSLIPAGAYLFLLEFPSTSLGMVPAGLLVLGLVLSNGVLSGQNATKVIRNRKEARNTGMKTALAHLGVIWLFILSLVVYVVFIGPQVEEVTLVNSLANLLTAVVVLIISGFLSVPYLYLSGFLLTSTNYRLLGKFRPLEEKLF